MDIDYCKLSGPFEITDEPMVITNPIVAIAFRYRKGNETGRASGSGFFLSTWARCIITSRHVVMPPSGAIPFELIINLQGEDGQWGTIQPITWAYVQDDEPSHDLAVIVLERPVAGPRLAPVLEKNWPAEHTGFDAHVSGYRAGTLDQWKPPVRAKREGPMVKYSSGSGVSGMSGGPLLYGAGALAVHSREGMGENTGSAVVLQFSVLNPCRAVAYQRAEEA